MIKSGGDYIDYLNFLISEHYSNYWKFEIERNSTPADHYKADSYMSVISLLEECRVFFINNVKNDYDYDNLNDYLDFIHSKSLNYSTDSVEFFAINMLILSIIELLKGQQIS